MPEDRPSLDLKADCGSCFGLCCVVPAFAASADFAIDKEAGQACPNLQPDSRCRIHSRLRQQGFPGCTVYDCFGAGQRVSQVTFGGHDWRARPGTAARMFEVFPVVRQLHELLWYLTEALTLPPARPIHDQLGRALDEIERLSRGRAEDLRELDVAARRRDVSALLRQTSRLVRSAAGYRQPDHAGADLIGADLRGADLSGADFIGADLRAADLGGADLTGSIFLTQVQLNAAKGDSATKFPPALTRPAYWTTTASGSSQF